MRARRAQALAGALGLVAGFALGCTVVHLYDAQDFDCPLRFLPQCCDSCGGISIAQPVCTARGWRCPSPSVSSLGCPGASPFCRPFVVGDAGMCLASDSGLPPSEQAYTAPGCEPLTLACSNDGTLGCALRNAQARHDACRLTADCVKAPVDGGCTGWGACPPFSVNAQDLDAFLGEAQAEVDRYCACPDCSWKVTCDEDAGAPRCLYGHCTWVSGQVSYACADRRTGACFPACAEDEACFTQVACVPGADGGRCFAPADAGGLAPGDDLCHPRCAEDGGCPEGQSCVQAAFYGCEVGFDGGPPPAESICCPADAGC